jgi:hypothetical protein
MKKYLASKKYLALAVVLTSACTAHGGSPLAPAAQVQTPIAISYDINVPSAIAWQQLITTHPQGVALAPLEAQREFDYSCQYGTGNVYYSSVNPPDPGASFAHVGIVVAPPQVAGELFFDAAEWPVMAAAYPAGTTFTWIGHFVFTLPAEGLKPYGACPAGQS